MKNLMENWNRFINEANDAAAEDAVENLDLSPEEMQAALKMLQGEKVQLEEGVMDSVGDLVKRFGKKAIMAALVTSLAAGAAVPNKAYASGGDYNVDTASDAPAQVVDAKAEKDAAAALGLISTYVDTKVEKGADPVDTNLEFAPLMKAFSKAKDGDMSAYDSLSSKDKTTFDTLMTKVKGYDADLYDAYLSIGMKTNVR